MTLLLEAGAAVNRRAADGCTPLHAACMHGHLACAQMLLVSGADADAELLAPPPHDGSTSMSTPTYGHGHGHGHGQNGRRGRGMTAMMLAQTRGHTQCVDLIAAHQRALSHAAPSPPSPDHGTQHTPHPTLRAS